MKIYLALTYGLLLALTFLPVRELYRNIPDDNSYFFRNNQIGGGDFIAFYLAGKMFEQNRANLYNLAEQQQFRTETLGVLTQQLGGELPFVYPAPVALFASVFSRAPFWTAYFLWMLFGFSVSVAALAALVHGLSLMRSAPWPLLISAVTGFIPFSLNAVMGGQVVTFGIVILSTTFLALRRGSFFLAGMLFSLSYYKPPLFVLLLIILLFSCPLKFSLGFACGATLLLCLSLLLIGWSGLLSYLSAISGYVYGREVLPGVTLPPGQGAGVFAVLVQLVSNPGVAGVLLLSICVAIIIWLRTLVPKSFSGPQFSLWFAAASSASIGLSIQCIRYDIALMLVPFFLVLSCAQLFSRRDKLVLSSIVSLFYFEFLLRDIEILGGKYQISSVLFVLFALQLFKLLSNSRQAQLSTLPTDPCPQIRAVV